MLSRNPNTVAQRRRFLLHTARFATGLAVTGASLGGVARAAVAITQPGPDHTPDDGWQEVVARADDPGVLGEPVALVNEPDRTLRLANAHTWEKAEVTYWSQGRYLDHGLKQLDYLLRDYRENEVLPIDPTLYDNLHALYQRMDTDQRIHVLSGYRTPRTNDKLRKRSSGVAKNSLHIVGRAIDINIPGVRVQDLHEQALAMHAGGVGFYKKSGFVHIDTGRVRHWEA